MKKYIKPLVLNSLEGQGFFPAVAAASAAAATGFSIALAKGKHELSVPERTLNKILK